MNDSLDNELLARYLSGECSPEESNRMEAWIASSPKNKKMVEQLSSAWNLPEKETVKVDINKLWQDTAAKAGLRSPPIFTFFRQRFFIYAAASLLLAAGIYFVLQSLPSKRAGFAFKLERIDVEKGKNEVIVLNDGSKITLDAGSVFMYPRDIGSAAREVYLEGEGYFEVSPDLDNPFIVFAQDAVIRVSGTSFNVRAWPQDKKVTVGVASGKVMFHSKKNAEDSQVAVTAGQLSTMLENGRPSSPMEVDISALTGWIMRETFFEDVPLAEILRQLERWFDVSFVLMSESYGHERLTVHIKNRPIESILELLGELTELEYERFGRSIILSRMVNR